MVLIDLDCADCVNRSPVLRSDSFMYTALNTPGQVDCRQHSLLIATIRNGSTLSFLRHSFENADKPCIDQISHSLEYILD